MLRRRLRELVTVTCTHSGCTFAEAAMQLIYLQPNVPTSYQATKIVSLICTMRSLSKRDTVCPAPSLCEHTREVWPGQPSLGNLYPVGQALQINPSA